MLADDELGARRERPDDPDPYLAAFDIIERDPSNLLMIADDGGHVVGCMQLTLVPCLSRRGGQRAIIEDVRVLGSRRGQGIGRQMIGWAIEEARGRGCKIVELFTHLSRTRARKFYAELGFAETHAGLTLALG
jgi:GNAT superfamily N-acetyltransferase